MRSNESRVGVGVLALVSGVIFSLIHLTIDFSLPGLSALQREIGNRHFPAELTLTVAFFGSALGQLGFGSIADRLGRRTPLYLSLGVYSAASLCAALSMGIGVFACARAAQSMALGVALVVVRAIVADICTEIAAARVFSIAIAAMALAGVAAPAIAGQLVARFGWRSLFFSMAVVGGAICGAIARLLPETLPKEKRRRIELLRVTRGYLALFRNPRFAIPAFAGGSIISCQFTYNTGTPSLFIEHFGMSTGACGLALSFITLGLAASSFFNTVLLKWFAPEAVVWRAASVAVVSAASLSIMVFLGIGGAAATVVALFMLSIAVGLAAANTMAAAVSCVGGQVGAASALLGFTQLAIGALASALVGFFHDSTGRPMGITILVLTLIALSLLARVPRPGVSTFQY